jgi:ribosomal protein S18 acetylase RimI-like enzyme
MEVALQPQILPGASATRAFPLDDRKARSVRTEDMEALAVLLYAAYRGTIDDEGESFADALVEIEKTFRGEYGRFLPECSFVIADGEFLASACLVSLFEPHDAPLVVFLMTRPEAKRRGLARSLLQQTMNALLNAGYSRLTLVVSEGNAEAQRLYASIGFVPILESAVRDAASA